MMRVRIGSTILGLPTSWIGEGKKTRFDSIEFLQTEGFFKGLLAKWTFVSLSPSATQVTIHIQLQMTVPLIGALVERILATVKIRPTVKGILAELKRAAESSASP
jgi:ribosome-associated toxin RatA of RatAB toxin-antitoxin module